MVTLSMLRFGQLMSGLRPSKYLMINENTGKISLEKMQYLQNELSRIKRENHYSDILLHQNLGGKTLNEDRVNHIERTVNEYLQNKISKISLINVCDVEIALETLKKLYFNKHNSSGGVDMTTRPDLSPVKSRTLVNQISRHNRLKNPARKQSLVTLSTINSSKRLIVNKSTTNKSKLTLTKTTGSTEKVTPGKCLILILSNLINNY